MPVKTKKLTHDDLRKIAITTLKRSHYDRKNFGLGCSIVLSELVTYANDIPDAIGWRSGHSIMIECKTSRSDFFKDAKKQQRINGTGVGEYRYFLTPAGLVKPEELPENWGLLEVVDGHVKEVVYCKRRELDLSANVDEKRILLSTIRRIRLREFLVI